jgi:hypothetical protein
LIFLFLNGKNNVLKALGKCEIPLAKFLCKTSI